MVPTAKEFRLPKKLDNLRAWTEEKIMIEFAKLHCIEQERVIREKAILSIDGIAEISNGQRYLVDSGNHYSETEIKIDSDSILNAYPLDNIK